MAPGYHPACLVMISWRLASSNGDFSPLDRRWWCTRTVQQHCASLRKITNILAFELRFSLDTVILELLKNHIQ